MRSEEIRASCHRASAAVREVCAALHDETHLAADAFESWTLSQTSMDGDCAGKRGCAMDAVKNLYAAAWHHVHDVQVAMQRPAEVGLWREVFAVASLMRSILVLFSPELGTEEALRLADLALIVAGPDAATSRFLQDLASLLSLCLCDAEKDCQDTKRRKVHHQGITIGGHPQESIVICHPIPELTILSLEKFLVGYLQLEKPVVLRGGCSHWPAVSRWCSADFWCCGPLSH
eukprot:2050756-Amphidinium_carterae.1